MNVNLPATGAFTRIEEGGYVNDSRDPGGATFEGVTLAVLRAIRHAPKLGITALRALSPGEWNAIFALRYCNPVSFNQLPIGVDLMMGDFAFNVGVYGAATTLQTALRLNRVDGDIGPVTIAAANGKLPHALVELIGATQADYYRELAGFSVFGRGWLARTVRRRDAALKLLEAPHVTA